MSQDESSIFGEALLLTLNHFINDFSEVGSRVGGYCFGKQTVERSLAQVCGEQCGIPGDQAKQDYLF